MRHRASLKMVLWRRTQTQFQYLLPADLGKSC
ncbi:hypothetical protein NGA_0165900 [Nannochloropsis gaditana CCMP526]|nr:hypothetical protein NGA_0165900 [Nannochloropsis gaditana CCMP526]EKU22222.1 hypothetical protein NGA_0165900 [Nannochloropsis gaditana CCMP526]|eukprot:XP_005854135.1 hypothetical protein NGA_0165900 [Nannochloropsis gaditana CCMP526]